MFKSSGNSIFIYKDSNQVNAASDEPDIELFKHNLKHLYLNGVLNVKVNIKLL